MSSNVNRVNLSSREAWSVENTEIIARQLGYVLNDRFQEAYNRFVIEVVQKAATTNLLGSVAEGRFLRVRPPLEKLSTKF